MVLQKLQPRVEGQACPGQWHSVEGTYITVADRRILYDTENIGEAFA